MFSLKVTFYDLEMKINWDDSLGPDDPIITGDDVAVSMFFEAMRHELVGIHGMVPWGGDELRTNGVAAHMLCKRIFHTVEVIGGELPTPVITPIPPGATA